MKLRPKKFQKVNAKIEEMLSQGINPLSYYINNKKKYNLGWYLEYRDFVNYLNTVSPSWNLLWSIDSFIHMLEIVYMYANNTDDKIYSFILKKSGVRSFRIQYDLFDIEYTLYEKDHMIHIKISRQNKESTSEISFPDGEAKMQTRADEILMFNIIEWTMTPVRELFVKYYKEAKEVKTCQKNLPKIKD